MIIWGMLGWFTLGVEKAGVLGDAMAPITSLLTAFTLGAALYSLELQRKDLSERLGDLKEGKGHLEERYRFESFISRIEQMDLQHHTSTAHCPWCHILEKIDPDE